MTAINLTPEYLASLRSGAEHMRDHNLVLQDVRGEVTLALLDACNERDALLARVKELEEERRPAHTRLARENLPGLAEVLAELRHHALAADAETDERQPDDRDMLSPKAAKISEMHALLTPAVVLFLCDEVADLEGRAEPPDPDKMTPEEQARHREACLTWLADLP